MTTQGESQGLSRADVEHIATLARLALSDEEIESLRHDLTSMLRQVALLNQLPTEQIPPSASVFPLETVMAPDEARPSLPVVDVLRNAPAKELDQFRVPPVFEGL